MGLQSPMESRKSEDARLQPAPEDGNATNLGREIYDRHLSMSSVAGPRSAAWQALRLETFGANRLPMLARLSQRWARVSILPAARTSAYEWCAARAASPRSVRSNPVSVPGQSTFPAASPVALVPTSEVSSVSAPVTAESHEPVHTPSVVTENPDKKVEWGPPIFQAGNSLRMSGARINRSRANGNEGGHNISPSLAIQENMRSSPNDKPILRQEARRPEPSHRAETLAHPDPSGRLPLVRPVEPVEGVASSIDLTKAERNTESRRQGSTPFNSATAESAVTPVRGQTSGTSDSGSPTTADRIPVDARDERRIPGVSFTQTPTVAVPLKHVNRIVRKALPLKGNTSNNKEEAGEPHRAPILPVPREAKQSQTRISTEDVVSRETPGASSNVEGDDIGQDSAQIDVVPTGLKSEVTRHPHIVATSEVSSLPLVTSHSPAIRAPEQSHLQRNLKNGRVESADESGERSKAPAAALPVVGAEAISPRTAGTIVTRSELPDSPKSLIAPGAGAPAETGIVSPIESPSQMDFPARLLAGKSQIFRSTDRHDAGETGVVAQSQRIDIPNSEAAMDLRTSVASTIEEATMLKQGEWDGELTYQEPVATASTRSVVDQNLELAGDSSNSIVFDTSVSQPDKGVPALSHSGAVASRRRAQEPQALMTRIASLAQFAQRTPVQEVHRSAGSNKASSISAQRAVAPGSFVQARSASNSSSVIQAHQISALPVAAERAHMQRAMAAAAPPDAIEGSVPLPFAAASAPENSANGPDIVELADRVYQRLLIRLASERSLRGM